MRKRAPVVVAVLLILALSGMPAHGAGQESGQWSMAGQNLDNTRHQAGEDTLVSGTVGSMVSKWVFEAGGDISATPTVFGGAVYFPDFGGNLWKLDAQSGTVIWSRQISDYTGMPGAISRVSPVIAGNKLILGDQFGAHIMAVDRNTGDLMWKTNVDSHFAAVITQSPVVFGNRVFVGISSLEEGFAADPGYVCCTFRGSVVSLDVNTGALLWKTYTVPEGYSGGAVWGSTPVVDKKRKAIYVTTGNNYEVPDEVAACAEAAGPEHAEDCLAPDDYIDAFLALDMNTGAVKWGRRIQGFDAWTVACFFLPPGVTWCPSPMGPDYDFGQGPALFSVEIDGHKRDLLGAGQKSGIYWALDPDTGEIVWSSLVGPGSALGGMQWGSATDGKRIYVAISNLEHKPYTLPDGTTANAGSWAALDAATGQILWQTPDPMSSFVTAPVTVAGGVVYGGSMDPQGHMYAFDAATGEILWSFVAGGSVNGGAAVVNGTVYWGSGYANLGLGTPNNKLFAFGLPPTSEE
ncbi:MAG TPA: PQQ-binding-like beta-propeller repeat protein [Symbiobacteriaceae bacterium]|nr:PQQ-binding-like beta-propeller repeat protein [Symbiobacteriaceae bacterium]